MVSIPRLEINKDEANISITLRGDLDDAVGSQLVDYLKQNAEGVPFIFVRTSELGNVDAAARSVLIRKLNKLGDIRYHMLFPDDENFMFAPGSCYFL